MKCYWEYEWAFLELVRNNLLKESVWNYWISNLWMNWLCLAKIYGSNEEHSGAHRRPLKLSTELVVCIQNGLMWKYVLNLFMVSNQAKLPITWHVWTKLNGLNHVTSEPALDQLLVAWQYVYFLLVCIMHSSLESQNQDRLDGMCVVSKPRYWDDNVDEILLISSLLKP